MQVSFEEFIMVFNNLSKLFYHELNGTATKQRMYCTSYTDHEFEVLSKRINKNIKKSNIKEKYNITVPTKDLNITIFVLDEVEDMSDLHHPYNIENSVFEKGLSTITIAVTTAIKDATPFILHYLYAGILREIISFIMPNINSKYIDISNKDEEAIMDAHSSFPSILGSVIIDYIENEDYEPYVKNILKYTKSNCDYIQLLSDNELREYIDSVLI